MSDHLILAQESSDSKHPASSDAGSDQIWVLNRQVWPGLKGLVTHNDLPSWILRPGSCIQCPVSYAPSHTCLWLGHPGSFDWSVLLLLTTYKSLSALVINCDKHVLSDRDSDLVTFNQSQLSWVQSSRKDFAHVRSPNPGSRVIG